MSILQHATGANIAAFNNMLRHVSQKGSRKVFNKRTSTLTPAVQLVRTGPYFGFIAFNVIQQETVVIGQYGAMTAKETGLDKYHRKSLCRELQS